ncbi:MAG: methyltransferase domain-containing protein [Clostridiales bacterium]|nr:methyltransferase domain-containing protein [Clostridiales bacterium]HOA84565.1 methyltransferase [Bacillota bacterium]
MDSLPVYDDERIEKVNDNIRLIQKTGGLAYGTDAYMLAAFVRPQPRARAAELGSGTGIVSLLCAEKQKLGHIFALEIHPGLADVGRRNIVLNGFEDKITQLCADIRDIKPGELGGVLDVVFSNPPYMPVGQGKRCEQEIRNIARHETSGGIADFCEAAARLLKQGGIFYVVWRPDRLVDLVTSLRQNRLEPKRMTFICPDVTSPPSVVLTEARLGAGPSLKITPPLVLYKGGSDSQPRIMTEKAARVYETCLL